MAARCQIWLRRRPHVIDPDDYSLLDETERSANMRFATVSLRARHASAHSLLRRALGQTLDCDPSSLVFENGKNGRPRLSQNSGQFDFNLSHSGPYVACAVVTSGRVGIDVEAMKEQMDYVRILGHAASPAEQSWLVDKTPDEARLSFYRLWVLKEAYAKARGDGLSLPFSKITLMPKDNGFLADLGAVGDDPENWSFALYRVNDDAALAVALTPHDAEKKETKIEIMEGGDWLS